MNSTTINNKKSLSNKEIDKIIIIVGSVFLGLILLSFTRYLCIKKKRTNSIEDEHKNRSRTNSIDSRKISPILLGSLEGNYNNSVIRSAEYPV